MSLPEKRCVSGQGRKTTKERERGCMVWGREFGGRVKVYPQASERVAPAFDLLPSSNADKPSTRVHGQPWASCLSPHLSPRQMDSIPSSYAERKKEGKKEETHLIPDSNPAGAPVVCRV
jgi:hypothetical protein